MKFIFLISFLFLFSNAFGQSNGTQKNPEKRIEKQMSVLSEKLSLTEDQKPKVKEVLESRMADRQKNEYSSNGTKLEDFQKKREELEAKLKAILTSDQFKKYISLRKEHRKRMKEGKKDRRTEEDDLGPSIE